MRVYVFYFFSVCVYVSWLRGVVEVREVGGDSYKVLLRLDMYL